MPPYLQKPSEGQRSRGSASMVGAERAADDRKGSRVAPLRRAGARGPGPEHGPRGAGSG